MEPLVGRVLLAAIFVSSGLGKITASAPDQVYVQQTQFMKNLAMMGGLLFVVAHGAGPLSVDKERRAGL